MQIVAQADDGIQALQLYRTHYPEIVVTSSSESTLFLKHTVNSMSFLQSATVSEWFRKYSARRSLTALDRIALFPGMEAFCRELPVFPPEELTERLQGILDEDTYEGVYLRCRDMLRSRGDVLDGGDCGYDEIRQSLRYIQENRGGKIALNDVAEQGSFSPSYFSTLFKPESHAFEIESAPNAGTAIAIRIPLQTNDASPQNGQSAIT